MLNMNKKVAEEAEVLVLVVNGGIGRNIMATAVVRNLKKAYPDKKIVVMCGVPEIFLKNPNIYRVYSLANPVYFYEDFIKNRKSPVLNVEPYQHYDYTYKSRHFVQCWCEMLNIECDSVYPEMFFTEMENKLAENFVKLFDRPFVLCQFEGGKIPEGKDEKNRIIARNAMYRRSLPEQLQVKIVDELNTMGFKVGVVAHENVYIPGCCDRIFYPTRAVIALSQYATAMIVIDSFLLHGSAVFQKPALALWSGTSPEQLGYDCHVNLRNKVCDTPECHRPNSYFFDIEPNGYQWECSHNNKCCDYEPKTVIEAFDQMTGGLRGQIKAIGAPLPVLPDGFNPYDKKECPDCDKHSKEKNAEKTPVEIKI